MCVVHGESVVVLEAGCSDTGGHIDRACAGGAVAECPSQHSCQHFQLAMYR